MTITTDSSTSVTNTLNWLTSRELRNRTRSTSKDFVNMMGSVYFTLKRYGDLLEKFAGYENGVMNKTKGYVNLPNFRDSPAMPSAHYT